MRGKSAWLARVIVLLTITSCVSIPARAAAGGLPNGFDRPLADASNEIGARMLTLRYGLAIEEARREVVLEDAYIEIAQSLPDFGLTTTAGSYIDHVHGGVLVLQFTSAVTRDQWLEHRPRQDIEIRTALVKRSTDELIGDALAVRAELEGAGIAVAEARIVQEQDALEVILLRGSAVDDPLHDSLLLERAKEITANRPWIILNPQVHWYVDEGCSISLRNCDPPLRGGTGLANINSTLCTYGFRVHGLSTGNDYVLSAKHCNTSIGTDRYAMTANGVKMYVGKVHSQYSANGGDAALVSILNTAYWGSRNNMIFVEASPWLVRDTAYYISSSPGRSASLPGGANLCHTGASAATTCGLYLGYDPANANFGMVDYASCPGDSGGPVFRSHAAYGLHAGAIRTDESISCEYNTAGHAVYQFIGPAMEALNVGLN